jgi:hypothetical protein
MENYEKQEIGINSGGYIVAAIYDGKMELWEGFRGRDLKNEECYYCGKEVKPPMVWWRGNPDIFLHPECVIQLFIRMMKDVHEIQVKTHTRFEMASGFDKP